MPIMPTWKYRTESMVPFWDEAKSYYTQVPARTVQQSLLNWNAVDEIIQEMRDNINDAKAFVQQEPLGPGEINQY